VAFPAACRGAQRLETLAFSRPGSANSAADIDVIRLNGYGFPRSRGGPMHRADTIGRGAIRTRIERYRERFGRRYRRPLRLLDEIAAGGLGLNTRSRS
jgi:3-hydroxyacyl-CoA dehydrogenase